MTNVKSRNTPGGKAKAKRPRIAPGVRVEIQRMLRTGASNLEIAGHYGVAEGSVRYIRKQMDADVHVQEHAAADAGIVPAADAAPDAGELAVGVDGLELGGDLKVLVRGMISKALAVAKLAEEDRNTTAAAKALRDAIGALPGLIRLEKADAENVDAVSIPRDLIEQEIQAIYGRARTLASVELCPRCGCELRMAAVGALKETKQ
ncbi:MAG TPA: hypothetical protein VGK73_21235 [Polyangiaceae bacterium]